MPRLSTLTSRTQKGQGIAENLRARQQVTSAMDGVYNRVASYASAQIGPDSYVSLGIEFRLLSLDEDGKHLGLPNADPGDTGPASLVFFEPRGAEWVAPVVIANPDYEKRLKRITDRSEIVQGKVLLRNPHSQASYLYSCLEWMFFQYRRQFYREKDGKVLLNVREVSRWLESGDIVPSVIDEKFYPALWGSVRWSPSSAFVPKKSLYPEGRPHIMITILIGEEPTEELLQAEVMTITAAIITRLDNDELSEHNTIPVMAITIFGQMKARVIEAHSSQQGLVIKKTQLFDFLTDDVGNKNMDILLAFMCADLVGKTKEPNVPINILQLTKGGQATEDEERRLQENAQQIAP
ncbi:hypothetical protein N7519_006454 [Penicillium mononematosum]|uniref:uncharacterized protein n=1 Tax=Penicillium mononematosum TaxID=268346 RepID=UPI0025487B16|nr:uncharacterized protein N7519_006454 [Penicillium mononematosum]KAJ6185153.1 hypothetical protein N7519_006454 [Penicillium mononematosum]